MPLVKIKRLVVSIIAAQAAGIIGSFATAPAIPIWYASLTKPSFTPPSWVFAPVWITLFLLIGVASFLIYEKGIRRRAVRNALFFYGAQLVINTMWSLVFFGLKSPLGGLIVIILLWILIFITFVKFYPISRAASYLLLPYLAWVSFATFLNAAIVCIN